MSHFLISAAHKSSGKTTICIGLCAALRQRGLAIQPFKKGPDYIDPMWLTQAAGRSCYNLDFYTQSRTEIYTNFATRMSTADLGLIEGNKGLYDGLDLDGSNSNAALAKLLHAPVVLVIDTQGITRGIAPLLLGYQAFDNDIHIAGLILNKVGGTRHETKLRQVVAHYTDIAIIGAIPQLDELVLIERHLGLMPSNEAAAPLKQIESIRNTISNHLDLERLHQIAATAPKPVLHESLTPVAKSAKPYLHIGIAMDSAFGFYYPSDLEAMEHQGVTLVPFSPLRDQVLPKVDGLFIGGGFPETCMEALEANVAMRKAIAEYIEAGNPVYAECGGLMYLARTISWQGKTCAMVGIVPGDAVMYPHPQGRGYVKLRETPNCPWFATSQGQEIAAHEFHYSRLENLAPDQHYAFKVLRGSGIDGTNDGIIYKNLMAGFTHLRDVAGHHWTERFLDHVRHCTSLFK